MRVLCSPKPAFVISVVLGLIVTLMAAGCAQEQGESVALAGYDFGSIDKVAVLSPGGNIYGEAVKDQIVSFFVMELMAKGYSCVELLPSPGVRIAEPLSEAPNPTAFPAANARADRSGSIPAAA